jgi:hypothetical protein
MSHKYLFIRLLGYFQKLINYKVVDSAPFHDIFCAPRAEGRGQTGRANPTELWLLLI